MCDPITAGVATFASGALQAVGSYSSAQDQANAANDAALRDYRYRNALRAAKWDTEVANYRTKIGQYKSETSANNAAAGRSYAAEQQRLNEQYYQAAFQQQGALAQLMQGQGQVQARGLSGKTAGRMNTAMLSAFGRNNAILAESLVSAKNAMKTANEDTRYKLQSANNRAWSQISVRPTPDFAPQQPTMVAGPSGASLALGLGSAALSGLGTYAGMKAPNPLGGSQPPPSSAPPGTQFNPGPVGVPHYGPAFDVSYKPYVPFGS